ncbi:MAG: ChbG/HpnK family deacetylase [Flavobacteriales bacterium]|jgi:predicted glycoside hydrolase/deacetylase ChbG (UPF0249 family)|nr:ChbG/HpnK family deacetylase [Flavobacteriales bacterium]
MKKIILNADDYGAMSFIDDAIEEAIELGIVTAVSVFVTFGSKNIKKIENLAAKYGDRIGIGLHFTLTSGKPIGTFHEVRSLYGAKGKNSNKFTTLSKFDLSRINREHVKLELDNQLNLLARILGGFEHIDHINSHQGLMHFIPSFWNILLETCKEPKFNNLPMRSPATYEMVRGYYTDKIPFLPITRLGASNVGLIRFPGTLKTINEGRKVHWLRQKQEEAEENSYILPNFYLQSYFGQPSENIIKKFVNDVENNQVGEFMLHIGKGNYKSEYNRKKHWGIRKKSLKDRNLEFQVLKESKTIQDILNGTINDLALIKYREI